MLLASMLLAVTSYAQIVTSSNSSITVTKEKKSREFDTNAYNVVSLGYSPSYTHYRDYKYNGAELDYVRGINMTKKAPLFFEVGGRLLFSRLHTYKNTHNEDQPYLTKSRHSLSLSVPLNVTYRFTFKNGFYLAPLLGANVRVYFLYQEKVHYEFSDIILPERQSFVTKLDLLDENCAGTAVGRVLPGFQAGLNLGKKVNFGAGYFINVPVYTYVRDYDQHLQYYEFGLYATVGFKF